MSLLTNEHATRWEGTQRHPTYNTMTVTDGFGISHTYTMDEVLSVLSRDSEKQPDKVPVRIKQ